MKNNVQHQLGVLKRTTAACLKELQKSPAIPKPLLKSFDQVFDAMIALARAMEETKVNKEER